MISAVDVLALEQPRILFTFEDYAPLYSLMRLHEEILAREAQEAQSAEPVDIPELLLISMIEAVNTPKHAEGVGELVRELKFLDLAHLKDRLGETKVPQGFLRRLLALNNELVSEAFHKYQLKKSQRNALAQLLKEARARERRALKMVG